MYTKLSYYFEHMDEFPIGGYFEGMRNTWEPLVKAKDYLQRILVEPDVREVSAEPKGQSHFFGNYYIGENTVIYNDVTIIGPVYIGKNCELLPGAVIRPNTIIGDGCAVGHGSEIKHCILFNGAKVASLSFAGDCVIGKSARLGSGVITANRKFDQSNVSLKADGVRIDLGDSFFGCILGDYSRLGANSVTQPGTHIGPHSWVFPLTRVRGFIPREKRVMKEEQIIFADNKIVELKP